MSVSSPLFGEPVLELLLQPSRWTLVGSHGLAEISPTEDDTHRAWLAGHVHAHGHCEICVVLSGEGVHACDGSMYRFSPGTVYHLQAGLQHDEAPPPFMGDVDQLWFAVLKDVVMVRLLEVRDGEWSFASRCSHMIGRHDLDLGDCRSPLVAVGNANLPVELRRLQLRTAVAMLVGALLTAGHTAAAPEDAESFQGQVIGAVCRHLEESAGSGESLDSLARLAGYSRFHFLRLFQQHTGRSVHQYIDECRMRKAKALQAAGRPQWEIATTLGFSSAAVFCRWHRTAAGRQREAG